MPSEALNVLLIGQSEKSFSPIIRRLANLGCHCLLTRSYDEASQLLSTGAFDLILAAGPLHDSALSSLASSLAGSQASVFYAQPVEESCWWLPALQNGVECFGSPAMRPGEFAIALERAIERIRNRRTGREPCSRLPGPQDRIE